MTAKRTVLKNSDIVEITLAPPPGHQHLRTTIKLNSGEEIVLQEATVANLVRAYVGIKTHPQNTSCTLVSYELVDQDKKKEFASWQLLEKDKEPIVNLCSPLTSTLTNTNSPNKTP
ncbi:MAG: hypothetical protein OQK12_08890 [Motiliproteus sp.]|nr:hypothetical protein [Motiliproteus sp.]MCW9052418.1 hypothetical protein [Motiliproteus sp.]